MDLKRELNQNERNMISTYNKHMCISILYEQNCAVVIWACMLVTIKA